MGMTFGLESAFRKREKRRREKTRRNPMIRKLR